MKRFKETLQDVVMVLVVVVVVVVVVFLLLLLQNVLEFPLGDRLRI